MNEKAPPGFYISCALGLEEALVAEIRYCWPMLIEIDGRATQNPLPELVVDRGGVLLQAPLVLGLQLNFFLKTASRVLLRLAEFKVRDFPKLYEKVQKFPWANYLKTETQVEWVVAASKSRLNNEKRIAETCREAFSISGLGPQTQAIYVRIHDDLCTLSLDTSGEHLHKRGWGQFKGEAPLRETLAAFMVQQLLGEISAEELRQITFVDPMCGVGTLLLEAASMGQPVFERDFAFLHWKNAPKILKSPLLKKNYKVLPKETPFNSYQGFDLDEKALSAAKENLQSLQVKSELADLEISFTKENLFEGKTIDRGGPEVWCLTNPPYGARLRVQGASENSNTGEAFSYQQLLQRMVEKHLAKKIGLLLPNKTLVKSLRAPAGYRKVKEIPLSNGGLEVLFLVYEKSAR